MTLREVRPPDLEMQVQTTAEHGRTRLSYTFHSPTGAVAFAHRKIAGPVLQCRPDEYQAHLIQTIDGFGKLLDIDGIPLLRDEIDRKMAGLGRDLWRELFPAEFRSAYREIRRSVRSWMIVSDEPHIPWELVKPYDDSRPDEIVDDDFLPLQFALTRWMAGDRTPALQILVRHIAVLRTDADLPQGQRELALLTGLAQSIPGLECETPAATSATDLLAFLATTEAEVLHFIGHGTRADGHPDKAGIPFQDRSVLRPGDLDVSLAAPIGRRRPLVFLNACWAGQQGWSLTGLGGWSARWVSVCGAGAFIAPMWPVRDQTALAFARTLYEALASGSSLGEAALAARTRLRRERSGDPSALLYTVYGHPGARVSLGDEAPEQAPRDPDLPSRVVRVEWASPKSRRVLPKGWALGVALSLAVGAHLAAPALVDQWYSPDQPPAVALKLPERPHPTTQSVATPPRSATATLETGGLTCKVSGANTAVRSAMKQALRDAAGPLHDEGISGWTLSLTLDPPNITPLVQGAHTMQSCLLAGEASASSVSRRIDLGPLSTRNAQFDGAKACEAAARPFAQAVIERFAVSIRKEGEP